jgi:hypothetical protein
MHAMYTCSCLIYIYTHVYIYIYIPMCVLRYFNNSGNFKHKIRVTYEFSTRSLKVFKLLSEYSFVSVSSQSC